jgi:hypothetical protein
VIPQAAAWADQHSYLKGDALAQAMQADHLQWDPSILALFPFPSILDMMARDPAWTQQFGNAVLTQNSDVMDAVQRMRQRAHSYGYLASNSYINVVSSGGYIQILPLNPGVIYVPSYDPVIVFAPPRPGFVVGGNPLRSGDHHWSSIRWMGMVARLRIPLAVTHHPHRSPAMDSRMGRSGCIRPFLRTPLGAASRIPGGSSSSEKVTALGIRNQTTRLQCTVSRWFPDSCSGFVVERKIQNLLLFSKRKSVMIPVGNLKVDSP